VTGMQQIENAVRESYSALPAGSPTFGLDPRCNFRRGNPGLQRPASTDGWK
jgi:hypothetical protein